MLEFLEFLAEKSRATLKSLHKEGKTYRSRFVAHENGYLSAIRDIRDSLELPQKNAELREAMRKFGEALKQ